MICLLVLETKKLCQDVLVFDTFSLRVCLSRRHLPLPISRSFHIPFNPPATITLSSGRRRTRVSDMRLLVLLDTIPRRKARMSGGMTKRLGFFRLTLLTETPTYTGLTSSRQSSTHLMMLTMIFELSVWIFMLIPRSCSKKCMHTIFVYSRLC
jgi:hypothetical protein